MTRDERQKLSLVNWIKSNCHGTIQACTGYGKTRVGINSIKLLTSRHPNLSVVIVVPTTLLKEQWESQISNLTANCNVVVINTAITKQWNCDLLILDECHRYASDQFAKIFDVCTYRYILGLTATLSRLDGKHVIIEKYCPTCDTVTHEEALENQWVSPYVEYKVVLHVDDIDVYNKVNSEFQSHFEFFNWDFNLAMKCVGANGFKTRIAMRDLICRSNPKLNPKEVYKNIVYHATRMMKTMQLRKMFINNHPRKIELCQQIIKARPDSKIITFSSTVDVANKIGLGDVYSGKETKAKSKALIEKFNQSETGVLCTIKRADEGLDVHGLNCAVILGQDSSPTRFTQRLGRAIRYEEGKMSEIFTFVIAGTPEVNWFNKSHESRQYITIDEENLMKVLNHEPYETYKIKVTPSLFRF